MKWFSVWWLTMAFKNGDHPRYKGFVITFDFMAYHKWAEYEGSPRWVCTWPSALRVKLQLRSPWNNDTRRWRWPARVRAKSWAHEISCRLAGVEP